MSNAASTKQSAEQPVEQWSSAATWSLNSAEQPAEKCNISASRYQAEVPTHKQTHMRPLPLPFTIDACILGKYYKQRQYVGHGQSKICYSLTDTLILKLCEKRDEEPKLFQELQASGVYPRSTHQANAQ